MAQIKALAFDVGADAYGRSVTLRFERTYDGKEVWTIHRAEANQRDSAESVSGLTKANLLALADAMRFVPTPSADANG